MSNNTEELKEKNRSGLSISSIVLGIVALLSGCIVVGIVPAIAGLVVGFIALTKKDKRAIWGIICSAIGFLIAASILVWAISDISKEVKLKDLIKNGEYEAALEMMNSNNFSSATEKQCYYDIYVGQEKYDDAFQIIFADIEDDYDNILSVSDITIDKLKSIYENVSTENKEKFDQFEKDRDALIQEKAEQEAKEKAEAEKAKVENEAKEKAEKEAAEKEKAEQEAKKKAEKEAKEKAEAEAKEKAEREATELAEKKAQEEAELAKKKAQEEADKQDKKQYGLTLDEFIEVLSSYSDPPSEVESEELLREYYQECFDEWKNDPNHFGWKKDSNGWYYEEPIDKFDIESMAVFGSYKDFMRYEQDYLGQYVVIVVKIGSESSDNEYICNDTTYYPDFNQYMTNSDTIIIRDERYYDDIKWLEGDYIRIYGKFMGVETRSFVYKLTGVETQLDVPVFEVYYADLVQE